MKRCSIALARKVLLKNYNKTYPSYLLNDPKVQLGNGQKHLVLTLDSSLCFIEHVKNKINKCNKIIGMMTFISPIKKSLANDIQYKLPFIDA